eukprot:GFKZ01007267.1.p1 GENE.GFKZ01007267.1~~GFKZ01007267.1.p1  ORF type:complete len:270 (+),score=46.11 GFKZ01007267.1:253-1062(+)
MRDTVVQVPTPTDFARRAQLKQWASKLRVPPERFRVRAWRWHHLGVVRDLKRVEDTLERRGRGMCEEGVGRNQVLDVLEYIVRDNWGLHNVVEKSLFLPWLREGVKGGPGEGRVEMRVRMVGEEREKLMGEAAGLLTEVERWVGMAAGTKCKRDVVGIQGKIGRLRERAGVLFRASEAMFVPEVVATFSESEQRRFNEQVLKRITGRQARVSLVVFRDAVKQTAPVVASKKDEREFERDIPAAIRKWALPFWRRRFVAHKIRFITGEDK